MVQDPDRLRPGRQVGHLVDLDAGWGLWRLAVLRSAGLPFAMLDRFAATEEIAWPAGPERDAALRRRDAAAVDAMLADDLLVSAMTWQNPKAVRDWVAAYRAGLLAGRSGFPHGRRDTRSAAVARYAQRYCAKNESVGFFGPIAWARFHDGPTAVVGDGAPARRQISYEVWALKAVAEAWQDDPDVLPHLPVRLDPACVVADGEVRRPHRSPVRPGPDAARLVSLIGAADSLGDLAERAGMSVADTARHLTDLREQQVIQVGFRVPLHESPETLLREQVAKVADADVAARLLRRLDLLDRAKADLDNATGPDALLDALGAVDRALTEATGCGDAVHATRAGFGRRTPVYHDSRRDLDARVGPAELAQLGTPLGVLLDSARWLTCEVADVVAEGLRKRYHELRANRDQVTLGELQFAAADLLATGGPGLAEVVADFQLRWAEIVDTARLDGDALVIDAGRARSLASALFPADAPRWSGARWHSPDLMLADTPDGPRWVVGELHVALNTMESRLFATQADDRAELVEAVRADWPAGRVVPVYPTDGALVSSRTYPPPGLDPPGHFRYWSFGTDDGHPDGAASTPAAGLVVDERGNELVAEAAADGWAAPVLECFGEFISALAADLFHLRPHARHTPRLVLGDVVVARAGWRFSAAEVPAELTRSRDVAHDRLRGWAVAIGMPRHVFVRTPLERKPFYLDWQAPLLVENLARLARRMVGSTDDGWVEVVEMLPTPDQLWLIDPAGRRYTSELRLVAIDPTPQEPFFRRADTG
jgi:hypothetical protein